jgi:1-deoxy-D-xylulose-5-phosphate reductoisomerase
MKKLLSVLGSTGSIGLTTLNIVDKKKNYFKPFIFSANKNYKLICKQITKYRPNYFVINDYKVFKKVKNICH